jgi:hypothetical protein
LRILGPASRQDTDFWNNRYQWVQPQVVLNGGVVVVVPQGYPQRCWFEPQQVWNGYGYFVQQVRVCQ